MLANALIRVVYLFVCLFVCIQSLHPNSTGNCSTVDGYPKEALNNTDGAHCTSGLGLTETQFNLLYSIVSWT